MIWNILWCVLYAFITAQFATGTTTLYLHRSSTHKSVKFNPVVEFFFQLILWLGTDIKRKEWVAVHLCHHAHSDKEGDPHSPYREGFWKVLFGNVLLYRNAAKDPEVLWYGRNIQLSWAERNLFVSYLGLVIGISITCWIFGLWYGLLASLLHMIFYLQLNSLVNAACHVWGYKNFPADAFNSRLIALFTGGEGLHNNHHENPGNAYFAQAKGEIDLGGLVIFFLTKLRLAKITREQKNSLQAA